MINKRILKNMSTERSYERGVNYYDMDMVNNPKVSGNTIFAEVSGKTFPYYDVEINIDNPDINFCTCPYDFGGVCKHIIALGLKWYHEQDSFQKIKEIDEYIDIHNDDYLIFEGLDRSDLIGIFNYLFDQNELLKLDIIRYREKTDNLNLNIIHEKLRILKERSISILEDFNRYGGGPSNDEYRFFDYTDEMIDILVNYKISKNLREEILKEFLDQNLKYNASLEDQVMFLIKSTAKTNDEWQYVIDRLKELDKSFYRDDIIEEIKYNHLQDD